eukprot:Gb_20372 [translate_table: standard]
MDGWIDIRNRHLLNIIVSSTSGPYFLRAIDCSRKEKNTFFLRDVLSGAIDEVGVSNFVQVITDVAPVCKATGLVQKMYKHIFWTPCCVHGLNNALKGIAKFDWIATLIEKGKKIQMFICNHHQTQSWYRKFSKVELLKPIDTRFSTYYILLERLLQVKGALCATIVSDMWAAWRQSTSDVVVEVRRMMLDDHFLADVRFVVDFIEPVNDVIRFAKTVRDLFPFPSSFLGSSSTSFSLAVTDARDTTLYPKLMEKIHGRWNKLNTPLHMAAYALNPKWYDNIVTKKRPPSEEVTNDLFTVVTKIYGDNEEATLVREQFAFFIRGAREFGDPQSLRDRSKIKDPINWWTIHGRHALELKSLATRLLTQVTSSSSCETN